ncbi:MAG: hypothetical protein ACRDHZ_02610 [Ktedonobacteraceae bacterium]
MFLGAFVFAIRLTPLSSTSSCRRLHIQGITPGIRFFGNPAIECFRPGRLLIGSTSNESGLDGYLVPAIRFVFL